MAGVIVNLPTGIASLTPRFASFQQSVRCPGPKSQPPSAIHCQVVGDREHRRQRRLALGQRDRLADAELQVGALRGVGVVAVDVEVGLHERVGRGRERDAGIQLVGRADRVGRLRFVGAIRREQVVDVAHRHRRRADRLGVVDGEVVLADGRAVVRVEAAGVGRRPAGPRRERQALRAHEHGRLEGEPVGEREAAPDVMAEQIDVDAPGHRGGRLLDRRRRRGRGGGGVCASSTIEAAAVVAASVTEAVVAVVAALPVARLTFA